MTVHRDTTVWDALEQQAQGRPLQQRNIINQAGWDAWCKAHIHHALGDFADMLGEEVAITQKALAKEIRKAVAANVASQLTLATNAMRNAIEDEVKLLRDGEIKALNDEVVELRIQVAALRALVTGEIKAMKVIEGRAYGKTG